MLYILTVTDGRPLAFELLERWLGVQTYADPFRWVVATRNADGYAFRAGQVVVEHQGHGHLHPLCANMLAGLDVIEGNLGPGDLVCCLEDDDYYAPGYLREIVDLASGVSLAGPTRTRYYNVSTRRYRTNGNTRHASLCQTAFRAEVVPLLRAVCERGSTGIDKALWAEWTGTKRLGPETSQSVGMKGLPGTPGIGAGHRLHFGQPDRRLRVFREWGIPEDYEQFALSGANR